nr:DUF1176 domain-containing protein [Marinicella sp. W31]MDC2877662.1 DUF1176 domain-containing protein [Marinicella sp. W31]
MNERPPEVVVRSFSLVVPALVALVAAFPASAAEDGLAGARALVEFLNPDDCDADLTSRFEGLEDVVHPVVWTEVDYEGKPVKRDGTLYEINCYLGAYNLVAAYVFAPGESYGGGLHPVTFAVPDFTVDYAENDMTQTQLTQAPAVSGFATETTLINPEFDPETNTISTFEKWRGLGDAYSSGAWTLENGRFVLKRYVIDPIYEANIEDPSQELIDQNFILYDAGDR